MFQFIPMFRTSTYLGNVILYTYNNLEYLVHIITPTLSSILSDQMQRMQQRLPQAVHQDEQEDAGLFHVRSMLF